MKPRCMLPAWEVEALWATLERQLDKTGLPTQPEVAGRLLALTSDPNANLRDFAEVIKADAPLSGRLLRFANSAFFAQRQPVTNLERACVLLGIERLKAVSLGFFLSRAAAADPEQALSRRIWGESLYRACVASELAKTLAPTYCPEAFVVGLMLDSGVPLLYKAAGPGYLKLMERCSTPTELYDAEFQTLPFTHVDILAALSRRWKLPELLARPLQRHHTLPRSGGRESAMHNLHRIAYYVGALTLNQNEPTGHIEPLPAMGDQLLGISEENLGQIVERATVEYSAMYDIFREVAESIGSLTEIALSVQQQLVAITDEVILEQLRRPSTQTGRFSIAGQRVEIEVDTSGRAVAYLSDAGGSRLLSYSFTPGEHTATKVLEGLGLEITPSRDIEDIDIYIRSMAA